VWNSDPASFSINLSLGSLLDPEFSRYVAQCLQSSGVAPDTIGFEIQEGAALRHREDVARFIQECEKAGCYIVLDDFTMHSDAVPFLGSRAVRVVKVDPKLSTAAMHDRLAQAMVIAISQACKVLGLHCVAKRIDSTASRQWLAAVGIDFAQGYALEDPRPIQTLATRPDATQKPGVQRPVSRS
jgi:EAL domain-containing protein (putative c-di-GMP-specific phosphodiesterase class I)